MFGAIIRVWAGVCLAIVFAQSLPLFFALLVGDHASVLAFTLSMAVEVFFAVSILLAVSSHQVNPGSGEGIFFTALLFLTLPVLLGLPFILGNFVGLAEGLFEGMSAATTSGASLLNFDKIPIAIKFWRAVADWIGGTLFLLCAMVVIGPLRIGGLYVPRLTGAIGTGSINAQTGTLAGMQVQASLGRRFSQAAKFFLPVWGIVTVCCIFLLTISGASPLEAVLLGLTTIVTSGSFGYVIYNDLSLTTEIVLAIPMLLGAISFPLLWSLATMSRPSRHARQECREFFLVLIAVVLTVFFAGHVAYQWDMSGAWRAVLSGINILTSTGLPTEHLLTLPIIMVLTFATIGGCSLSTASGLKIFRFGILLRGIFEQIYIIVNPSAVHPVQYGKTLVDEGRMASIQLYFVMLVVVTFLGALGLALSGLNAQNALLMAFAAVNGVLSVTLTPELVGLVNGSDGVMAVLSCVMLLGRIDLVLFIMLFSRSYWRG